MSSMKLPADGNYLAREFPLFLTALFVFTTGPFFFHQVHQPCRIYPGSDNCGRHNEPDDPDPAVIAQEEDQHTPAENPEINQDQAGYAEDKRAPVGGYLKVPPGDFRGCRGYWHSYCLSSCSW
jgi:hypothetical protein